MGDVNELHQTNNAEKQIKVKTMKMHFLFTFYLDGNKQRQHTTIKYKNRIERCIGSGSARATHIRFVAGKTSGAWVRWIEWLIAVDKKKYRRKCIRRCCFNGCCWSRRSSKLIECLFYTLKRTISRHYQNPTFISKWVQTNIVWKTTISAFMRHSIAIVINNKKHNTRKLKILTLTTLI